MEFNLSSPPPEEILDLPLSFANYYKHKFLFIGAGVDQNIYVYAGGQSGEIYNFFVAKNAVYTIRGLQGTGATVDVFLNPIQ